MKRLVLFMMAVMLLSITVNAQKKGGKTLVAYFSATGTTARAAKLWWQKLLMGPSTKYSLRKSTRLLIWTGTTKLRAAVWRCRIPNHVLHCILNWEVSRSMIPFI